MYACPLKSHNFVHQIVCLWVTCESAVFFTFFFWGGGEPDLHRINCRQPSGLQTSYGNLAENVALWANSACQGLNIIPVHFIIVRLGFSRFTSSQSSCVKTLRISTSCWEKEAHAYICFSYYSTASCHFLSVPLRIPPSYRVSVESNGFLRRATLWWWVGV